MALILWVVSSSRDHQGNASQLPSVCVQQRVEKGARLCSPHNLHRTMPEPREVDGKDTKTGFKTDLVCKYRHKANISIFYCSE